MIGRSFLYLNLPSRRIVALVTMLSFLFAPLLLALAMDATRNGVLPQRLPLFPADNWWNLDISNWPVDQNSPSYINFINNGGTRKLHPDFGGNSGTGYGIYGLPYALLNNVTDADRKPVQFQYWDESDGVNLQTGASVPFYPIPDAAASQPYWVEGGDPGNIDKRSSQDRHLLLVDRERNHLYELYNVFYNATLGKWYAGSGAFFDMNTNNRRPDTWTSADAAGLAILPGLVRYDEVYDPNVTEINHALRVTVRASNGYVYPASHRAGSTLGALPMGARLRLKNTVNVAQRTSDPNVQKIFRAMQRYGLIVADNGSDMYITGTYDTRWNNGVLNPAFANLSASDFEVIQLGYNPVPAAAALASVTVTPASATGGQSRSGTVTLTSAASATVVVNLTSNMSTAQVPTSVTIPANASAANFTVTTQAVSSLTAGNISASYNNVTKSASISLLPAPVTPSAGLASLTLSPTTVSGAAASIGTVTLTAPAPAAGLVVKLSSNIPSRAKVPTTVTVPSGSASASFTVTTVKVNRKFSPTITASYSGVKKTAVLTITR
ncbi:MAG TPA: hypothetical protein VE170_10450 [Candidatus Limnocylindria bacterium]|nr:hypothetical protein [Candidatus Limnocylindria bacterium]